MARIPLSTDASASGFALLAALAADATAHGTAATPPPPPKRLGRHVAFDCAATSWLVPIADVAAVARGPGQALEAYQSGDAAEAQKKSNSAKAAKGLLAERDAMFELVQQCLKDATSGPTSL